MSSNEGHDKSHLLRGGLFMATVTGASIMFGFGMTLAMAKKRDPSFFNKGLIGSKEISETGGSLALRALGWGTLYSVSGFSLFCFGVWKLMGVSNLREFREKMQSMMAFIPKKPVESQGRSDFKNFRELLQYVLDEDKRKKNKD